MPGMASNEPASDTGSSVHRLSSTRQRLNTLARLRRSRAELVADGTPQPMRAEGAPTSHLVKTPASLVKPADHYKASIEKVFPYSGTQVSPHTLNVSDSAPVRRVQAGPPRGVGVPEPEPAPYGLPSPSKLSGAPVQGATRHSLGEESTTPLRILSDSVVVSPQHTDTTHEPASSTSQEGVNVGRSSQILRFNSQDATTGEPSVHPLVPSPDTNLGLQLRAAPDHYPLNTRQSLEMSGLGSELEESLSQGNTHPRMRRRLEWMGSDLNARQKGKFLLDTVNSEQLGSIDNTNAVPLQKPEAFDDKLDIMLATLASMKSDLTSNISAVQTAVTSNASRLTLQETRMSELDNSIISNHNQLDVRISKIIDQKLIQHSILVNKLAEGDRIKPTSQPPSTPYTQTPGIKVTDFGTMPMIEEVEDSIKIPLVETDTDDILNKRQSLFYGISQTAIAKSHDRLPKQFTDGTGITAKYNHYQSESIVDFIKLISKQLRYYPKPFWIAFVKRQLSPALLESVEQYEDTLKEGREMVQTEDGSTVPCPAGFYRWPEFEQYLLTKYNRPLKEIETLQHDIVMYELKQTASIEKYMMEIDDMISKTSVKVLPDMLFNVDLQLVVCPN